MQIVTIGQSLNWLCIKITYIYRPDINGFQILLFRSIICTIATYLFVNKDIKNAMVDSVPRDQYANLFFRCMQGMVVKSIQFSIFKYWKLTTISMIVSLGPIFTVLGGILCLGESVNCSDVIQIALSFIAICFITLNSLEDRKAMEAESKNVTIEEDSRNYARRDHFRLDLFLLLLSVPFGISVQNILLRKMKKMNSNTISCYVNPFMALGSVLMLLFLGSDTHNFMYEIVTTQPPVLAMFVFMGTSTLCQQIAKFKAHQHESAAKNSVWVYLETPYQWLYDFLFIHSYLNTYQLLGLLILSATYYLKINDVIKE